MGCDIHCFAEKEVNGKWKKIGLVFKNEFYNKEYEPDTCCHPLSDSPLTNRNYDLFALLANVRNGTWGEEVVPIAEPRGLPEDVSKEVKKISDDYDCDGHSHSFLILREILEYDWNRILEYNACVGVEEFKEFLKNGKPKSYCAASSGENVSNEEMRRIIKHKKNSKKFIHTYVKWKETYKEVFRHFLQEIIPQLKELSDPNLEWDKRFTDIRIVFWFDN